MKNPLIRCRSCKGKGRLELAGPLAETYQAIQKLGSPSIPQVWRAIGNGMTQSGANRRVERLVGLGLIKPVESEAGITRYVVA